MSHVQQMREAVRDDEGPGSDCKRSLLRLLDSKIIPELCSVHDEQPQLRSATRSSVLAPTQVSIASFALLCCAADETHSMDFVGSMLQQGYTLADVLENLVAPAARFLGEEWDRDQIDFSTVAHGLVRMQNITHHFVPQQRQPGIAAEDKFRILLAALPGTGHLLGLTMVQELFASDGWNAKLELASNTQDLLTAVATDWFDVFGLSVGLHEQIGNLPDLISGLRCRSLNPRLGILLGGAAFLDTPSDPHALGADAICLDPKSAIRTARRIAMQTHSG